MENYESFDICNRLKLEKSELGSSITPSCHKSALRRALMETKQQEGFLEKIKDAFRQAAGMIGAAFRSPVFKPALAIVMVLALTMALLPVLNSQSVKVSASDIALSDPQVRASFTPDELTRLNVQEMDASNGEKVVVLTCDAAMVAVGVDMKAKKVTEWLINNVISPAKAPTTKYQVFFESFIGAATDIFIVCSDGSNLVRLTDNANFNDSLEGLGWSEKSGKLVFSVNSQVYTMNPDGTDMKILAALKAMQPVWSPDGTKIAFSGTPEANPDSQIYVVNADGGGLTRLTNSNLYSAGQGDCTNTGPQWSPDGKQIAFDTKIDGNWEISVMNADGSNPRNLTNDPARDYGPSWSPDGTKIAFISNRAGMYMYSIYVMNADGSGVYALTQDAAAEPNPPWSPDGRKIAFNSKTYSPSEIITINADGSDMVRLTDNLAGDYYPSWSPDGQLIAYISGENTYLYVINSDGSNNVKLADKVGDFAWASLSTYPVPLVPQVKYADVTTPSRGLSPYLWPITKDKAVEIASKYLPANIVAQARISPAPTPDQYKPSDVSVGHWTIQFFVSVTKSELGSDALSLPHVIPLGDGPYVQIIISIDGTDGSPKWLIALPKSG
jgi:Tol biopolymer transport system component